MINEKILLAEDEEDLSRAISTILKFNKYDVTQVYNGLDAVNELKENVYDCIVMDIMMPVMDGIEALKTLRKSGNYTPIIFLTAKSETDDKATGLDLGANDYLTKPFNNKELLARIRALIRNSTERKEKITFGSILFDKGKNEITKDNISLKLNNKESELMEMLIKNKNRKVEEKEITKILDKGKEKEQEKMAEAGCKKIAVGVETLDKRANRELKKFNDLEDYKNKVRNMFKICNKYNIEIKPLLMMGIKGQSKENVLASLKFLASIGARNVRIAAYSPRQILTEMDSKGTLTLKHINAMDKMTYIDYMPESMDEFTFLNLIYNTKNYVELL